MLPRKAYRLQLIVRFQATGLFPDKKRLFPADTALCQSGILQQYPDIDLGQQKVGVWSRPVKQDELVKEGDRIEIYRPLIADPKDLRRRRAEKAKEEGRADKVTGGRPHDVKASSE